MALYPLAGGAVPAHESGIPRAVRRRTGEKLAGATVMKRMFIEAVSSIC